MSCCQYRMLQVAWDEAVVSRFGEAVSPTGQARPHPAICDSSQPSSQPHWPATTRAARTIADRGVLLSKPKPESVDRWTGKGYSCNKAAFGNTYQGEAVQPVEAGTVHCTRTRHGQLGSAMHRSWCP